MKKYKVKDLETGELSHEELTINEIFLRDFELEFDSGTLPPNDLAFWFSEYEFVEVSE